MNNKIVIIFAITNIVAIICFTILAIVFNRWWIVFFSILFITTFESRQEKDDDDV